MNPASTAAVPTEEAQSARTLTPEGIAELEAFDGGGERVLLASTLEALWLGEVRTLVVAEGVGGVGSECSNCGRLEPGAVSTCRACGGTMRPVHDVFHRAMARTIEQAGRVEVVHGDAARRLRAAGGGLGALLRFRAVTAPVVA